MPIVADVQTLDLGKIVDMFVLDTVVIGGEDILHFYPDVNELAGDVVWQGVSYARWPTDAQGFELNGKGTLPRPTVRVANIDGTIGFMCRVLADMVGAKVIRKRTLYKYLDAVNYPGGVNASANPDEHFKDEIYFINRKIEENAIYVHFELTASWDVTGVMLPRGQVVQNACPWKYRGPECGYTGTAYFDVFDDPAADLAHDVCAKRLNSCKMRFGQHNELPFGGFPIAVVAAS